VLLTTKYSGSNYVKPESDIRNVAFNIERLRWINTTGKKTHLTCVVKDGVIINYKQDERLGYVIALIMLSGFTVS
jgi:hypothetical protein